MSENKLPKKAIVKVVESADEHLGKTYDNVTNNPSEAIGEVLTVLVEGVKDVAEIVRYPVKYLSGKLHVKYKLGIEKYEKELKEKYNSIPKDKLTEPDVQVITTAIENSKYCVTEDELREMFVNLIGSACNSDTKDDVNPAFSAIIKEMSPHDAKVLRSITGFAFMEDFDIMDIVKQTTTANDIFLRLGRIPMSVDNLVRLGLLRKNYRTNWYILNKIAEISLTENEKNSQQNFDKFLDENPDLPKELIEKLKYDTEISYSFTNMGRKFIEVCC